MRLLAVGNIVAYDSDVYLLCFDVTSKNKTELIAVKANFTVPPLSLLKVEKYSEIPVTGGSLAYLGARKIIKVEENFVSFVQDQEKFLYSTLHLVTKKVTEKNSLLLAFVYYLLKRMPSHEVWKFTRFTERFSDTEKRAVENCYQKRDELFREAVEKFVKYAYVQYLTFEAEKRLKIRVSESEYSSNWKSFVQSVKIGREEFFSFVKRFFTDEVFEILESAEDEDFSIENCLAKVQGKILKLLSLASQYRKKNSTMKQYAYVTLPHVKAKGIIKSASGKIILVTGAAGTGKTTFALSLSQEDEDKYLLTSAVRNKNSEKHGIRTIQSLTSKWRKSKNGKPASEVELLIKSKTLIIDEASYLSIDDTVTVLSWLNRGLIKNLVLLGDLGQTRISLNPSILHVFSLLPESLKISLEKVSYRTQNLYLVVDDRHDTTSQIDLQKIMSAVRDVRLKMAISDAYVNTLHLMTGEDVKKVSKVQGDEDDESVLFLKYYSPSALKAIYTAVTRSRRVAYVFLNKHNSFNTWKLMQDVKEKIEREYQNVDLKFIYNGHVVDGISGNSVQYRPATEEEKKTLLEKIPRLRVLYPELYFELTDREDKKLDPLPGESFYVEVQGPNPLSGESFSLEVREVKSQFVSERRTSYQDGNSTPMCGSEREPTGLNENSSSPESVIFIKVLNVFEKIIPVLVAKTSDIEKPVNCAKSSGKVERAENSVETQKKKRGRKPTTSLKILNVLREYPKGLSFGEICKLTKISKPTLKKLLNVLKKQGKIRYEGGVYIMARDDEKIDRIDQNVQIIKDILIDIKSIVTEILEYHRRKEESFYRRKPVKEIDPTKIRH